MRTLLISLLTFSILFAAGETTPQQQIRQMIQEVQNAPEGERYKVMNRFKEMVRTMNQEDRKAAVEELKASMNSKEKLTQSGQAGSTRTEGGDGEQKRMREREQIQNLQNQQMQQRSQMQKEQQVKQQMGSVGAQPKAAPQGTGGQGTGGQGPGGQGRR